MNNITTSPSRGPEDERYILVNLLSNLFANQLIIGDIHAPMNRISDLFKIVRGDKDIIGGWSIFHGFDVPSIAFPIDPTGWEAIKGFLSVSKYNEFIVPFPVIHEDDHGMRPWDDWPRFKMEKLFTDIAMRITTKDIEVHDISNLPLIRAATSDDVSKLETYYTNLGDSFSGFFHPLQLESDNYVVCVEDGEIIATAGTHYETPYTVQLGNIHVNDKYRGRGIGRAVTTAVVLGAIKTQRVPTLFVNEENVTAKRLYEKMGFEEYNKFEFWKFTRI